MTRELVQINYTRFQKGDLIPPQLESEGLIFVDSDRVNWPAEPVLLDYNKNPSTDPDEVKFYLAQEDAWEIEISFCGNSFGQYYSGMHFEAIEGDPDDVFDEWVPKLRDIAEKRLKAEIERVKGLPSPSFGFHHEQNLNECRFLTLWDFTAESYNGEYWSEWDFVGVFEIPQK